MNRKWELPDEVSLPCFLVFLKGHACRYQGDQESVHENQLEPHDFVCEGKGPSRLEASENWIVIPGSDNTLRISLAWQKLPDRPEQLPHKNDAPDEKGSTPWCDDGLVLIRQGAIVRKVNPSKLNSICTNGIDDVEQHVHDVVSVDGLVNNRGSCILAGALRASVYVTHCLIFW